ncbi:hypothetical protein O181_012433 [Austropuccinia psidii MF-1]|uniref:Uncharacterized protein n=1 Tax=Austropuccinia psidii MF-1 TaxID=1389203 RepID=A0A9Q3GM77_9BASI|nr:hypothetical protein [Austropuccinia psidii MF-1]
MEILKKYIEQELKARILFTKRFSSERDRGRNVNEDKEKKFHLKEEAFLGMNEAFNRMKEINEPLKEQKRETKNDSQGENGDFKKFMTQLEELKILSKPQMGGVTTQRIPKPYVKFYHFLEEGNSVKRRNYLYEDQNKTWVSRQGGGFLFLNWQRVPTDGKTSPKRLVEEFAREQEELSKKRKEDEARESAHKPNEINMIEENKNEISSAIAKIEDWRSWQPPTISSANDPFLNNYGFRNTKQRSLRSEHPNQEPTKSLLKTMETLLKKKPNIPGA